LIEQKGIFPDNWGKYPEIETIGDDLRLDRLHGRVTGSLLKRLTAAARRVFEREKRR
jgi:hypothetical protein